jgi:hypothetical protein
MALGATVGCFPEHGGLFDAAGTEETGEAPILPAECDPLRQDCPNSLDACHALDETAVCTESPPDGLGKYGTPCSTAAECAQGLGCGPEVVPGCSIGFGCCTHYCDPTDDSACGSSFRCAALYSTPPPEIPQVGLCVPV